jgi:hypothetical protein
LELENNMKSEIEKAAESLKKKLKGKRGFLTVGMDKRTQSYTRAEVMKKLTATLRGDRLTLPKNAVVTKQVVVPILVLYVEPIFIETYNKYYNFEGFHVITEVVTK